MGSDKDFVDRLRESKKDREKGVRKYLKDAIKLNKLNPFQDVQNKINNLKITSLVSDLEKTADKE